MLVFSRVMHDKEPSRKNDFVAIKGFVKMAITKGYTTATELNS